MTITAVAPGQGQGWMALFLVQGEQALVDGFRLHRGEQQVAGVEDEDRPCPAAFGHIDQFFFRPGVLLQLSDRGRSRVDHRQDATDPDGVTKTNVDESAVHGCLRVRKGRETDGFRRDDGPDGCVLLDILHLFTQFFDFILHFDPQVGDVGIGDF